MNAFVRQLAVLSVLWSVVELLLPDGRKQPMIRMTMGVLVMTALLTQAGKWLGQAGNISVWSVQPAQKIETSYHRTALRSLANQVENYCVRQAQRAGYRAKAGVWLAQNGEIEQILLHLTTEEAALISPEALVELLCQQLQTPCVRLEGT